MRTVLCGVAGGLAVVFLPFSALAQVCVGNPPLGSNSSGNVGGSVSFFDGGKGYSAGAVFGRRIFGSANFSYLDFDDTDLSLKSVSGSVGYEVNPRESEVTVCPALGASYGFGLEILGVDVTTVTVSPAVSVGLGAVVSPTVTVAPFAQAAFVYNRVSADAGPLGEESESDTSGALTLGVGFIFNGRLSLGPSVYLPIGTDDGDTVFAVGLVVALGGSR